MFTSSPSRIEELSGSSLESLITATDMNEVDGNEAYELILGTVPRDLSPEEVGQLGQRINSHLPISQPEANKQRVADRMERRVLGMIAAAAQLRGDNVSVSSIVEHLAQGSLSNRAYAFWLKHSQPKITAWRSDDTLQTP